MLLFLAMPMLTVGGILFLMTNLQVEACPHPRHLAGGWGGLRAAKTLFHISCLSRGLAQARMVAAGQRVVWV